MKRIEEWIAELADPDATVRDRARHELIAHQSPEVLRELVGALIDPQPHVRWEAAKALQAIADPVAAPGLVNALDDDHEDVRWVAAEGLIALGKIGQLTVLSGLTKRAGSLEFCKSAHHVLHEGEETPEITAVVAALEQQDRAIAAPLAAYRALAALNQHAHAE